MRLKIGSTYQKAVTIIEKLKGGERFHFYLWKKWNRQDHPFLQYHKETARGRCSDRSHRSPARCVPSSRTRSVCTSSGRISKATQAAFVRGIR